MTLLIALMLLNVLDGSPWWTIPIFLLWSAHIIFHHQTILKSIIFDEDDHL